MTGGGRRILPPAPHRQFEDGQFDGDKPRSFGFQGSPFVGKGKNSLGAAMPPWHLWGSTQVVNVGTSQVLSAQIARVSYKRPDTWRWFFASKIVSGPPAIAPGTASLIVLWDITFGLGRSQIQLPSFDEHDFNWLTAAPVGAMMYSNTAQGPQRIGGATTPNDITQIVAENIQLNARVTLTNAVLPTDTAVVEVSAYFAPVNHIRPDWFRDGDESQQYIGDETEGR